MASRDHGAGFHGELGLGDSGGHGHLWMKLLVGPAEPPHLFHTQQDTGKHFLFCPIQSLLLPGSNRKHVLKVGPRAPPNPDSNLGPDSASPQYSVLSPGGQKPIARHTLWGVALDPKLKQVQCSEGTAQIPDTLVSARAACGVPACAPGTTLPFPTGLLQMLPEGLVCE